MYIMNEWPVVDVSGFVCMYEWSFVWIIHELKFVWEFVERVIPKKVVVCGIKFTFHAPCSCRD